MSITDTDRLNWIEQLDCDSHFWDELRDTTELRNAIDAMMIGTISPAPGAALMTLKPDGHDTMNEQSNAGGVGS